MWMTLRRAIILMKGIERSPWQRNPNHRPGWVLLLNEDVYSGAAAEVQRWRNTRDMDSFGKFIFTRKFYALLRNITCLTNNIILMDGVFLFPVFPSFAAAKQTKINLLPPEVSSYSLSASASVTPGRRWRLAPRTAGAVTAALATSWGITAAAAASSTHVADSAAAFAVPRRPLLPTVHLQEPPLNLTPPDCHFLPGRGCWGSGLPTTCCSCKGCRRGWCWCLRSCRPGSPAGAGTGSGRSHRWVLVWWVLVQLGHLHRSLMLKSTEGQLLRRTSSLELNQQVW